MTTTKYEGRNVRVDDVSYTRLKTLCDEEGRSLKEVLRRAVLSYWNSNDRYPEDDNGRLR